MYKYQYIGMIWLKFSERVGAAELNLIGSICHCRRANENMIIQREKLLVPRPIPGGIAYTPQCGMHDTLEQTVQPLNVNECDMHRARHDGAGERRRKCYTNSAQSCQSIYIQCGHNTRYYRTQFAIIAFSSSSDSATPPSPRQPPRPAAYSSTVCNTSTTKPDGRRRRAGRCSCWITYVQCWHGQGKDGIDQVETSASRRDILGQPLVSCLAYFHPCRRGGSSCSQRRGRGYD